MSLKPQLTAEPMPLIPVGLDVFFHHHPCGCAQELLST